MCRQRRVGARPASHRCARSARPAQSAQSAKVSLAPAPSFLLHRTLLLSAFYLTSLPSLPHFSLPCFSTLLLSTFYLPPFCFALHSPDRAAGGAPCLTFRHLLAHFEPPFPLGAARTVCRLWENVNLPQSLSCASDAHCKAHANMSPLCPKHPSPTFDSLRSEKRRKVAFPERKDAREAQVEVQPRRGSVVLSAARVVEVQPRHGSVPDWWKDGHGALVWPTLCRAREERSAGNAGRQGKRHDPVRCPIFHYDTMFAFG